MQLRDYQGANVEAQLTALSEGVRSTLSGIFTGAGKTVVFCELAGRVAGRTLIVPPLREVVWQTVGKVRDVVGLDPGLEMGEFRCEQDEWWSPKIVVASKQTLIRGRYRKFTDIELVVVDEAHMSFSEPCLEMFRWFNERGAMVAGYTATPFRQDGTAMTDYYQRVLCSYDIQWAIDNGWAVPPECKLARVEGLDLSRIRVSGGDFHQQELQKAIEMDANLHRIALITKEEMVGQTIVCTPSVASSKGVCHYLHNNYNIPAVHVDGKQNPEERNEALQAFKSGRAKVLCNCAVVSVGFDYPPAQTVILGRPTRSRSFWLQIVGRACRPLPGVVDGPATAAERIASIAASGKPTFRIVDCTDASLDHRLVTAVDMFCGGDKETKEAVKRAAEKKPLTQEEMDQLAREEAERRELAKRIEAQRQALEGQAYGRVAGRTFDLTSGSKRNIGTYMNPLKGKYAGLMMSQLPQHYIDWACNNPGIRGWIKNNFLKERSRRRELAKAV
jgi:superfamily II DNA or RNA helicase